MESRREGKRKMDAVLDPEAPLDEKRPSGNSSGESQHLHEFVLEELTVGTLELIRHDRPEVEAFRRATEEHYRKLPYSSEREKLVELSGRARSVLERLLANEEEALKVARSRLASVDFGVEELPMKFRHDYDQFVSRVEEVSRWHTDGHKAYLAPYFPMIQSSGVGKTKILYEYKQNHALQTRFILCSPEAASGVESGIYDKVLAIPRMNMGSTYVRQTILKQLDDMVTEMGYGVHVVILLFDEAQLLLETGHDGFALRVIRWWLRRNKFDMQRKEITAVFAATTLQLADPFFEEDTSNAPTFSREVRIVYNIGTKLYDPFCQICTIGLLKQLMPTCDQEVESTDLDNAVRFGRPLFALLAAAAPLTDETLLAVQRKLRLDEDLDETSISLEACLSVLGTRVQMGQTSWEVASEIVARSYACLTTTTSTIHHDPTMYLDSRRAFICFFPDPVCAFGAMKMMMMTTNNNSIDENRFRALPPSFWTKKAISIFDARVCFSPIKGDVGMIASALYLLFCGDVLRTVAKPRTFAVPLCAFLQVAAEPKDLSSFTKAPAAEMTLMKPHISFIHVGRNFLRHTLEELTSKTSSFLEEWFQAGCAVYSCPNAWEPYDIIAPIRIRKGDTDHYYPMLISIKNQVAYSVEERTAECAAMMECFETLDEKVGIYVLLLIGLSFDGSEDTTADTRESIGKALETWKGDTVLTFTIVVPHDDPFGCWNLATQASLVGGQAAELYASHLHAHQTAGACSSELTPGSLLRSTATSEEIDELATLIEAYETVV